MIIGKDGVPVGKLPKDLFAVAASLPHMTQDGKLFAVTQILLGTERETHHIAVLEQQRILFTNEIVRIANGESPPEDPSPRRMTCAEIIEEVTRPQTPPVLS